MKPRLVPTELLQGLRDADQEIAAAVSRRDGYVAAIKAVMGIKGRATINLGTGEIKDVEPTP